MKKYLMDILRLVIFSSILLGLFAAANFFFRPVWLATDNLGARSGAPESVANYSNLNAFECVNYDTTEGFYANPRNTIQTLFIGASMTTLGVSCTEMYENRGICAYSVSTEAQPILASYYWLKEGRRLHPETLNTVVLDVSMLRREIGESFYKKSLDGMHFSKNKFDAAWDASMKVMQEEDEEGLESVEGADPEDKNVARRAKVLEYLMPIFAYHDRWKELGRNDFVKFNYDSRDYLRGFSLRTLSLLKRKEPGDIVVPEFKVDESAKPEKLSKKEKRYYKKIVEYCKENNLKLILIKTPSPETWNSAEHNAIQKLADKDGLTFIDFNYEPYLSEEGYVAAVDGTDKKHLNYYGAQKLTRWLGDYLADECGVEDVRGKAGYEFMDEQLATYKEKVEKVVELKDITYLGTYLNMVSKNDRYVTFISTKNYRASLIDDAQREMFRKMGLTKLADLQDEEKYIGFIDKNGIVENSTSDPEEALIMKGVLPGSFDYDLESIGNGEKADSQINIGEFDFSINSPGINIAVYDIDQHIVVDNTIFDTYPKVPYNTEKAYNEAVNNGLSYTDLPEILKNLYLYDERLGEAKEAALGKSE